MELGQPERAFAIFAAPYQPLSNQQLFSQKGENGGANTAAEPDGSDDDRRFREGAFDAARQAGLQKEAVAFALSLLLEPGTDAPGIDTRALRYLEQSGVDLDRVLLGILEAPEHLRSLAAYTYAAADLLTLRASPRLLPTFVQMSESDDVYLHARGLLGLSVIAYRARPADHGDWVASILPVTLTEYGISAAQRRLIGQRVLEAAHSGEYRLRAAAALAMGLLGQDEALPALQQLARDHAYILTPNTGRNQPRSIRFPVREAAAAALARYGIHVETGDGELAGRNLEQARRGGQDVTLDRSHLRHDVVSVINISPTDVPFPFDPPRR
jgi:HEAT repeat protein